MDTPEKTPKNSPKKSIPKPGFLSRRPPKIEKFDNPSLTQDINEIIRREENATKNFEQDRLDSVNGSENTDSEVEQANENIAPSASGEQQNFVKKAPFEFAHNMSILEEY